MNISYMIQWNTTDIHKRLMTVRLSTGLKQVFKEKKFPEGKFWIEFSISLDIYLVFLHCKLLLHLLSQ